MLTNKELCMQAIWSEANFSNKKSSIDKQKEKKNATVKSKYCVILLKSYS